MDEIFIAIITSLIASLIFWVVFDYLPNKKRYNKVRPKVEFDIYEIFVSVSIFLGMALDINKYGWSFSRRKIELGEVTKEDFNLWLQNKCLNSTYQFDEMGAKMLPIGEKLDERSKMICDKIEKGATYYSFMTAEEIILLRKIAAKVRTYSYTDSAVERVDGHTFRPLIPNIAYMAENFTDISKLYLELRNIVWSYKKIDRSINKYIVADFAFDKANKSYLSGDFKRCIKYIKKSKFAAESSKQLLLFKAYYNLGKKKKAESAIRIYFENTKTKTIALHSLLDDSHIDFYTMESWVGDLLSEYTTEIDLYEAIESSEKEKAIEKRGYELANEIKSFYENKSKESDVQAQRRMAEKKEKIQKQLDELGQISN